MRDYAKVSPRFWTGETGRMLRALGRHHQVIALYLLTCPSANMLGLYYLPLPTLCHETGIDSETARAVLQRLGEAPSEPLRSSFEVPSKPLRSPFEAVFARYDEASEYVWVVNMAAHQLGERISRKDNRHKAIVRELEQHRKCPFFNDFLAYYSEAFELHDLQPNKPLRSPFKVPSKPLRSQEQEQEIEQEQEKDLSPPFPLREGERAQQRANGSRRPRSLRAQSADAWDQVLANVRSSEYRYGHTCGGTIDEAVRRIGGYQHIGQASQSHLRELRSRFREYYELLLERADEQPGSEEASS